MEEDIKVIDDSMRDISRMCRNMAVHTGNIVGIVQAVAGAKKDLEEEKMIEDSFKERINTEILLKKAFGMTERECHFFVYGKILGQFDAMMFIKEKANMYKK